jgi:hypothetical protein
MTDNTMVAAERNYILAVIKASVLSAYFLYGFPGGDRRGGAALADDKYGPFTHYQ